MIQAAHSVDRHPVERDNVTSVFVMNGPNLSLLGASRGETAGGITLADVDEICRREAAKLGLDIELGQSDFEGQLIEWIHQADLDYRAGRSIGAVLNPGALAYTSIALHDAIDGTRLPVIEVHIPNPHQRDGVRRRSYVSLVATGTILGLGADVYRLGILALHHLAEQMADM